MQCEKKELKSENVDSSELGKYYDEEVLKKAKKARRQKIWKIVQRVVIGVVASTVICSTARNIFISGRSYFKNSDLIPQVTSELCTDMDMMHYEKYNNQIIRLKPNDDGNVCVYIADNVPQRAQQNIKSSLNYFNEIFVNVNDKFNSSTFFYFFSDDLKTNLKNYLVDNNYIDSLHYYRVFDYSYGDYTFSLNFYYQKKNNQNNQL